MSRLESERMAIVRSFPGTPSLSIQVQIAGKMRNLDRPKDEMVEKPLMRLQKTACQKPKGGKKKSKEGRDEDVPPPAVSLYGGPDDSFPLLDPATTSNEMAWRDGHTLKVGDAAYEVVVDPPFVERLLVHGSVFAGVPAVPYVETADADRIEWQWYRISPETDDWVPCAVDEGDDDGGDDDGGERARSSRSFVPRQSDIGNKLMVSCTPVQRRVNAITNEPYDLKGFTSSVVVGPVVAPPASFASAGRSSRPLSKTAHPEFRVMSYNILADQYASTDRAKDVLFAHCPSECLESQYRRPLVFKEILDYKPDVACLQEVDASAFDMLLRPGLLEFGMCGVYTNKAGKVKEGSATFWREDRFRVVDTDDMEMRRYFPKDASKASIDAAPLGPALRLMFESSPALCEALQKVGTIAQLTLLVPSGPVAAWGAARPLCVVNTHLFFHYAAPHIRTIHVWAMLHHAKEFIDRCLAVRGDELGHRVPSVVFCGDLNSDINDGIPGAVRLLESGALDKGYWDWKFGKDFAWGSAARGEDQGEDQSEGAAAAGGGGGGGGTGAADIVPRPDDASGAVAGMDLTSPFALRSADGMEPEFTNYVRGYQGLLDYVWYDTEHIRANGTAPMPTKEQLGGYLPCAQYPSDHLAVVADLAFRSDDDCGDRNEENDNTLRSGLNLNGLNLPAVYKNVAHAETALLQGRVIAVPTDTIYGIAALASSSKAIQVIYDIKRRDHAKPLAVCVADHHDIPHICHVKHLPNDLLSSLLPGPVTVILDRKNDSKRVSDALNPGVDALAVRIPDFPFLRAICRQVQTPLALTSANLSGEQSPVHTSEFGHIAERCAVVFDHGALGQRPNLSDALKRAGSTIVDLRSPGGFRIVREGSALEETVGILVRKGLRFLAAGDDGDDLTRCQTRET